MSPGLTPDSVTVKPVLAVVRPTLTSMVWIPTSSPGISDVEGHHAVAIGGRLRRRGYVQGANLDQAYGHEGLEALTADGHGWNRGRRWCSDRVIIPSGTSWATVVTTSTPVTSL